MQNNFLAGADINTLNVFSNIMQNAQQQYMVGL